jgi:hypothetical protein
MIKRILMTAVVLGGLCGVSLYADTFIVGVENTPTPTDPTEGIGDFNDLMVQLSAAGLTVTTSNGSWNTFNAGVVTHDRLSNSGSAFWANNSLDTPNAPNAGQQKNIGYCLTTTNCSLSATPAAVTQFLGSGANGSSPANDFFFTFSGSIGSVLLGGLTPNLGNESIGIYQLGNGGNVQYIVQNGVNVVGSSFTPNWSSFGLFFLSGSGNEYLSQNSAGAFVGGTFTTTGVPDNRFALFSLPDATVPEPGTMALFGLGALALGLSQRLRKRS